MLARLRRLAAKVSWAPPLIVRVVLGISFILTGWGKLHHLDQVIGFFRELGIPAAEVQAPFVAGAEFIGGALVLLGFGTRIAAALLAGVMTVAIATAIWPDAGWAEPIASWSTVLGSIEAIYLATFLYLVVHGAGALSLDHLAARRFPALHIAHNQPQE
ncbi:MAG TPA: DoxX family protein [Kofleriaceae bacterium]|nr:DoxX family protein [Kofleriaceae bacterium]